MSGAPHVLTEALKTMRFTVEPQRFALAGFPRQPADEDLALLLREGPAQVIREGGETTVLAPEEDMAEVLARHPEASVERGLRWIRFETEMAWDLVGFLSLISSKLAEAKVPIGAVCGYSHDHIFVHDRDLEAARGALRELFPERGGARR